MAARALRSLLVVALVSLRGGVHNLYGDFEVLGGEAAPGVDDSVFPLGDPDVGRADQRGRGSGRCDRRGDSTGLKGEGLLMRVGGVL